MLAGEVLPLRNCATSCAAGLAVAFRPRRCCSSSDSHMEKDPSTGRPPIDASLQKKSNLSCLIALAVDMIM